MYAVKGGYVELNYSGIESGVMLIKPSVIIYNKLINALNSDHYDIKMSDQSFINDYFMANGNIKYLDEKWNSLQKRKK